MYKVGRVFMFRIPEENDLLEYINKFASENNIDMAWVNVIGSVRNVELGYYDESVTRYVINRFNGFFELVACVGNISVRDNKPFTHLHAVISDRRGKTYAGHLMKAKVYIAESFIIEILGEPKLERKHTIGNLWLWRSL